MSLESEGQESRRPIERHGSSERAFARSSGRSAEGTPGLRPGSSVDQASSPGRRRFVRFLGLGGALSLFAGALGGLASGVARGQSSKPATPPPPAPAAPPAPPAPSEEAKALHKVLVGRYGDHLDDAQEKSLLDALENTVQAGKALRAKKLANSVEPDVVFAARTPERDRRHEGG